MKKTQSLLGKLNVVAACVRPGSLFVSRMLRWSKVLYNLENKAQHPIFNYDYVKKDLLWWHRFLPQYRPVMCFDAHRFWRTYYSSLTIGFSWIVWPNLVVTVIK